MRRGKKGKKGKKRLAHELEQDEAKEALYNALERREDDEPLVAARLALAESEARLRLGRVPSLAEIADELLRLQSMHGTV